MSGYKQPPVDKQFKPGVSGNPGGRPKTVRTLQDYVLDELNKTVTVGKVEMTRGEKIAKAIIDRAEKLNMDAVSVCLKSGKTKEIGVLGESPTPVINVIVHPDDLRL